MVGNFLFNGCYLLGKLLGRLLETGDLPLKLSQIRFVLLALFILLSAAANWLFLLLFRKVIPAELLEIGIVTALKLGYAVSRQIIDPVGQAV